MRKGTKVIARKGWCCRNWFPLTLIALALTGLLVALLLSLEPCKQSTSTNAIELVFALDASGSFQSEFDNALNATSIFIQAIESKVGKGKLSVGVAQWNAVSNAGGGFYSFVPPTADASVDFPYPATPSRAPSSDISASLQIIASSSLEGTSGGTTVEMPLFGCLEILENSQNEKAAKGCVIFTDAAWSSSDLSGTPRFAELCSRHDVSPCNADGVKAAMERDGMFVIVGWLEPGTGANTNAECPTSSATLSNIRDGIEMSTCRPFESNSSFLPDSPWSCDQATACTADSDDEIFQDARCCPYWLELSNYDTLVANVGSLAEQIGNLAGSSSFCVGSWDFLWALLLFLPFLLYLVWRPLNLATKAVMAAAPTTMVPPPVPRRTPATKKKNKPKKTGRWSIVETRHYYVPGSNGGSKPMAVDYGDALPLPPTALGMKASSRKTNYHAFDQFAGLKTKDFYNRGNDSGLIEEGDIDDYIMKCCCLLCCRCRCCVCCGRSSRKDNAGTDIEMGVSQASSARDKKKANPPPVSRAPVKSSTSNVTAKWKNRDGRKKPARTNKQKNKREKPSGKKRARGTQV